MDNSKPTDLSWEALQDRERMRADFESGGKQEARRLIVEDLQKELGAIFSNIVPSPTIKTRVKEFSSYYNKRVKLAREGMETLPITDFMGIRIVCPFIDDTALVEKLIGENFNVVETERKGGSYSVKEFGYESIHLLIEIPERISRERGDVGCDKVEIQIRTTLQDAWAEVEHEIFYKAEFKPLDTPMKRKLFAVNANLYIADMIFQEIRLHHDILNIQWNKRRGIFHQKVEESSDAFILSRMSKDERPDSRSQASGLMDGSIDDLLLNALTTHNNNQFDAAIAIYSRILEKNPDKIIRALIYKHRGMANFTQAKYEEAISDFTSAFDLDEKAHLCAYYRGVARSVLQKYSEAIGDYDLSLKINPFQHYCFFRRAQAYYHVGDYPQALADCNSSLALNPDNAVARKFLDLIRDKLED